MFIYFTKSFFSLLNRRCRLISLHYDSDVQSMSFKNYNQDQSSYMKIRET